MAPGAVVDGGATAVAAGGVSAGAAPAYPGWDGFNPGAGGRPGWPRVARVGAALAGGAVVWARMAVAMVSDATVVAIKSFDGIG
jgi:hypothetical protein